MSLKDVQTRKIRSVTIDYFTPDEHEPEQWNYLRIEFDNGSSATISRLQVEAFLRIRKVAEDLQAIQNLRDDLLRMFGSRSPIMPPQKED